LALQCVFGYCATIPLDWWSRKLSIDGLQNFLQNI